MVATVVRIVVCFVFLLLIHRGTYSPAPAPARRPGREYLEVALIAAGLLIVPHVRFDLWWYSGWLSAYFVFGLLAPLLMELLLRKRPLSVVGFQRPRDPRALTLVGLLFVLVLTSRLAEPLLSGRGFALEWRELISAAAIFPFLEEVLFRGLIQTRLESALGAVRAWVVTGLLFGGYHGYVHYVVLGQELTTEGMLGLVYLAVFGMLLGVVFAKTRSVLPSFLLHAINNVSL